MATQDFKDWVGGLSSADPAATDELYLLDDPAGTSVSKVITVGDVRTDVNKTIYVDSVNGNDSTGERGNAARPFATGNAAIAVASSEDVLYFRPGTNASTNITENVYVYGDPKSIVNIVLNTASKTAYTLGPGRFVITVSNATANLFAYHRDTQTLSISADADIEIHGNVAVGTFQATNVALTKVKVYGTLNVENIWNITQPVTVDTIGTLISGPTHPANLTVTGPGFYVNETDDDTVTSSTFKVRQPNGTPGTDDMELSCDGSNSMIESKTGEMRIDGPSGVRIRRSGTTRIIVSTDVKINSDLNPNSSNSLDLGTTSLRWQNGFLSKKLEFLQSADQGASSSNSAYMQGEDISGAQLVVENESGTRTQITSHPWDAPDRLYAWGRGLDEMTKTVHRIQGVIEWINNTAMTMLEQQRLDGDTPTVKHVRMVETFAEYNARTGSNLVTADWEELQDVRATKHEEARLEVVAEHDEWQKIQTTVQHDFDTLKATHPNTLRAQTLNPLEAQINAENDSRRKEKLQKQFDRLDALNFGSVRRGGLARLQRRLDQLADEEPELLKPFKRKPNPFKT